MIRHLTRFFFVLTAMVMLATMHLNAQSNTVIKDMTLKDIGMGGRMMRMSENSIFLDDAGMHFEGYINMDLKKHVGKRIVCIVNPLDTNGNILYDEKGEMMNMKAFVVEQANTTLNVDIPYMWLNLTEKQNYFPFGITLLETVDKAIVVEIVNVDSTKISVDRQNIGDKLASDLLGGSEGIAEMFLGGLFGADEEIEHTCHACDGDGICSECYGAAFFDPSKCRRCAKDPGICRRCKGSGKETISVY